MASSTHRPPHTRGYTLLELIVVVALVALLVGLSLPAMRGPLSKSELRSAARQVCHELAKARLDAIQSGVARQFRFRPGTRRFEIARRSTSPAGTRLPFTSGVAGGPPATAGGPLQGETARFDLPDGVCFFGQKKAQTSPIDFPPTAAAGTVEWSTPVMIYANGRTSSARIRLHGERGYYVDLTLRGLTGSTKIGKVLRQEPPP